MAALNSIATASIDNFLKKHHVVFFYIHSEIKTIITDSKVNAFM